MEQSLVSRHIQFIGQQALMGLLGSQAAMPRAMDPSG